VKRSERPALQLSLFPVRGFALLLRGDELAVDTRTMLPVIRATRRASLRDRRVALPTWLRDYATVVEVSVHEDLNTGVPTYVIGAP
jgi:hypothetical protein